MPAQFLLFLPLMRRNARGDFEGSLAESWQHSADYRRWTIKLRPGVRWHDGVPVTAEDVKFTLDLLAIPEVGLEEPDAYSVTAVNDSTVTINFRRLVGYWDYYTVFYPRHLLQHLNPGKFYEWDFWQHPVGNGPYRYSRSVPKTMLELEANPDYFRGKPRIEQVVLKFGEPAITELLSGNVDVLYWAREMDLLKIAGDPRFNVYGWVQPDHIRTIAWNHRRSLFQDPNVRRALTLAINRKELHRVLNLPEITPVFDMLFTRPQFFRQELPKPVPYDPTQATSLLEKAGWHTNRHGIRERNGVPFRFNVMAMTTEDFDRAAVYIQQQLQQIGVRMEVFLLDEAAEYSRLKAGEFEAALMIVNEDINDAFGHVQMFGRNSLIGYHNGEVAALLEKAATTFNPDETDQIYREMAPLFQADQPVTFLFPLVRTTVTNRSVRGMSSPYREDPVWYMDDLWLEDQGH